MFSLCCILVVAQTHPLLAEDSGIANLGKKLFFDKGLSFNSTQSCATCHIPEYAFSDRTAYEAGRGTSIGADGSSLGNRNTPSINYAGVLPIFHREDGDEYVGGFFQDGSAATLGEQIATPITAPTEMAMSDRAAVISYLRNDHNYNRLFQNIFGDNILENPSAGFTALIVAISAYLKSYPFVAFDSKYDRYLKGRYKMTKLEEQGRIIFFSDLLNCMNCHMLHTDHYSKNETFADNRYYNIGVPKNHDNNSAHFRDHTADLGLALNPRVEKTSLARGRFRTPSLRNIAVTAPYMHNGVFKKLETAIAFYNQYLVVTTQSGTNPETSLPWRAPAVPENIARTKLRSGQPIGPERMKSLVAFLKTLTDAKYEHLLSKEE